MAPRRGRKQNEEKKVMRRRSDCGLSVERHSDLVLDNKASEYRKKRKGEEITKAVRDTKIKPPEE